MERRNLEADEIAHHREHVRAPAAAFFARKDDVVDAVRSNQLRVLVVLLIGEAIDRLAIHSRRVGVQRPVRV